MFIKSIILDGFKSYGHRTEVNGFDDKFTAITGLNGSGKSNILDAICFVLGISNLSHVRASSLQDLIYKSGQAGVNKATVSIIFDNNDRDQCPPGFENINEIVITRQIVIGGKNRYMINGTTVQNKKVQDLFCSVQLNVNNPHFLVMQGKITKVLNMKPAEILAMIEEAAGTKMYELKKQATQKLIDKKDAKLAEMEAIITEELFPKLQKLREERQKYMEFKALERELEYNLCIYQAWEYLASQRAAKKGQLCLEEGEKKIEETQNKIDENNQLIKDIDKELETLAKKSKSDENPHLKELEANLKEEEKKEAVINSKIKSVKENIANEEAKKLQEVKTLAEDEAELNSKEADLKKMQSQFESFKQNDATLKEAAAAAQRKFEALTAGMEINDDGEAETILEQIMSVKKSQSEASGEKEQSLMQLEHNKNQLKSKESNLGSNTATYQRDCSIVKDLERQVGNMEANLKKIAFSQDRWDQLHTKRNALTQQVRPLRGQIENFEASRPFTTFRYRDPETNFKRTSVHGVVCRLIKVKDPQVNVAIETAAGGRLYNVIVDSNTVSKKLLERGNLQMRTTFIPLNQIQAHKMSDKAVRIAQQLVGKENAQPALAHLLYDETLQPAMEFIFGSIFICKDLDVAKAVAFHDQIRCKCVTLDGDVVDPAGTLSGGAAKKGGSILQQISDLKSSEDELKLKEGEMEAIEREINELKQSQEEYNTLKQKFELKSHEMNRVKLQIQQSTHHLQLEEINGLKTQIVELSEKIKLCDENLKKYKTKLVELESRAENNTKGQRQQQLKEAEQQMDRSKEQFEKSQKEWKKVEAAYDTVKLEIDGLTQSIANTHKQIQLIEAAIDALKKQLHENTSSLTEIKITIKEIQDQISVEMKAIALKNEDIQLKLTQKERTTAEIYELELKLRELNHELKKLRDDFKNLQARQRDCERKTKKDDRCLREASDLTDKQGKELENKIRRSQDNKNKLGRTVNAKAQSMFEHEETLYNETRKKQKLVETDKKKLLEIMGNLDRQKEKTLKLAFDQISKDFGSIFATLLPGANAQLKSPKGQTILQGIEIKVCLGNVWKDNLTELSGGQRSLAALSLILSMLLFKPAPLYILDEVDAALDLSHTQNIGNMLKSHFKTSQFIIVSLKDGMFNNANVLYRTKFVDGVSTVSRTQNKS